MSANDNTISARRANDNNDSRDIIEQLHNKHLVGATKLWEIIKREGYNKTHKVKLSDVHMYI